MLVKFDHHLHLFLFSNHDISDHKITTTKKPTFFSRLLFGNDVPTIFYAQAQSIKKLCGDEEESRQQQQK